MTVLRVFEIKHNKLPALKQVYEQARKYYDEVSSNCRPGNPDHLERFEHAERMLEKARYRYLRELNGF